MGRGRGLLIMLGVVAVLGGLYWWQERREEQEADATAEAFAESLTPVSITYHVKGTAESVDITVQSPSGTEQATNRVVPLGSEADPGGGITMEFLPGDFVYISAQNGGERGHVECRIDASDGTTISENRSEGAFAIATCEGTAR